jgi:hypothetical protein
MSEVNAEREDISSAALQAGCEAINGLHVSVDGDNFRSSGGS